MTDSFDNNGFVQNNGDGNSNLNEKETPSVQQNAGNEPSDKVQSASEYLRNDNPYFTNTQFNAENRDDDNRQADESIEAGTQQSAEEKDKTAPQFNASNTTPGTYQTQQPYNPYYNQYSGNAPQQQYNGQYYGQQTGYGYNQTPSGTQQQFSGYQNYTSTATEDKSPYLADSDGTKKPKKKNTGIIVLIVILALVIVAAIVGIVIALTGDSGTQDLPTAGVEETLVDPDAPSVEIGETPDSDSSGTTADGVLSSEAIAEKLEASNVGIVLYTAMGQVANEGSGIVMTADGYIITCAHVISDAASSGYTIKVFLDDSTEYDATVVGYDEQSDVGVIKASGVTNLTPAEFGDSDSLKVGETVYAIGNPGGMSFFGSFTQGVVSAIDRPISSEIGYTMNCIQHDAAINPGNSGGMLVNKYGQVVGINSSKISGNTYEGMSFAIPMSQAKDIVDSLIQYGYVKDRAKLGITYISADSDYYYSMLVRVYGLPEGSIVIKSVSPTSDLINYDVQQEDLIVAVNGEALDSSDKLVETINGLKPGDEITLTIVRINPQTQQRNQFDVTCRLIEDNTSTATTVTP